MEGWKYKVKVFITGGTGFIGRYLVQELQSRGDVLLLLCREPEKARSLTAMANVSIVEGDLSHIGGWRNQLERFSPDAAVHLAWEGLPDYGVKTSIKNLRYGLDLLTTLAEVGCKTVIAAGSCWEYGQQNGKLKEDMPAEPYNAFTAAKNALHWLGREIAREKGMNFIWTRLFYVYGPEQRENSLIPYIISSIRQGKKPELKTPSARNDFIYVADVARAVTAILNKSPKYAVCNIGSGVATPVQQVSEIICSKLNVASLIVKAGKPVGSPGADFWADISSIKNETGWEPETGIEEGIQKTIEYYLENSK